MIDKEINNRCSLVCKTLHLSLSREREGFFVKTFLFKLSLVPMYPVDTKCVLAWFY